MIAKSTGIALLIIILYGVAVAFFPARVERIGATMHQGNIVRLENALFQSPPPANMIVGSSVCAQLDVSPLGKEWADCGIRKGSVFTGLKLLADYKIYPKNLFIEINHLERPVDADVIDYFEGFPSGMLRREIPVLRQNEEPVNLMFSLKDVGSRKDDQGVDPSMINLGVREKLSADSEWQKLLGQPKVDELIGRLAAAVKDFEAHGTRVYLVWFPVDPRLTGTPHYTQWLTNLQAAFPLSQYHWIAAEPGESFRTTDGEHLSVVGAAQFLAKLVQPTKQP